MVRKVTIIDYGMGNLWSVAGAFQYLGAEPIISGDPIKIAQAKYLVLPGVGSFRRAMETILAKKIDQAIGEALNHSKTALLGICLGMQLLGSSSTEDGETGGLGLVPNKVKRLAADGIVSLKIPNVGFSEVNYPKDSTLFKGIPQNSCFYFVHSYFMELGESANNIATASHGQTFVAAIDAGQIYGTQFHPEKSQTNGLRLLNNFLEQI